MPYNHKLYLENCRKMIPLNEQKVRDTKAAIERTKNPTKRAELYEELEGWQTWVKTWEDRLAEAEKITIGVTDE